MLCPPKIHVEALIPNWMVLGGGALGRQLGCEGEDFVMGLVPLK